MPVSLTICFAAIPSIRLSRTPIGAEEERSKNAAKSVIDIHFCFDSKIGQRPCLRTYPWPPHGLQALTRIHSSRNAYTSPFALSALSSSACFLRKVVASPTHRNIFDPRADEDAIERRQRGPLLSASVCLKVEELCFLSLLFLRSAPLARTISSVLP